MMSNLRAAGRSAGQIDHGTPRAGILGKFRRVTNSGRYIPEIDGLRFVAIAAVFLVHLGAYLRVKSTIPWAVPWQQDPLWQLSSHLGHFGVPLFFVISGFILGLPFAHQRLGSGPPVILGDYFMRRLTRLEPPYLISLTVYYLSLRLLNGLPWDLLNRGYASSALYLHNLLGRDADVINAVGWSLEIEVQFYLLAPLLSLVFAVRRAPLRRLIIAGAAYASIFIQCYYYPNEYGHRQSLLDFIQYFLAGFLLADLYLTEFERRDRTLCWLWDGIGLLSVPAAIWAVSRKGPDLWLPPLLFSVLIAATLRGRLLRRALTRPWATAIGGMCYSIYLIHYQVISLVGRFTKDIPFSRYFWADMIAQTVVVGLPTLVCSAFFYLLIEKPCMRKDWPQRLLAGIQRQLGSTRLESDREGREVTVAGDVA